MSVATVVSSLVILGIVIPGMLFVGESAVLEVIIVIELDVDVDVLEVDV